MSLARTPAPVREMQWRNLIFFIVTGLVGLFGTSVYICYQGLRLFDILLMLFFMAASIASVTMGYHRLFAHGAYRAHPVIRFLYLFFGAAAFEQPALRWASQHRNHHLYVDTEGDPYNSRRGFWYSHIGWLVGWHHSVDFRNVRDLKRSRLVRWQWKHYNLWAVLSGIVLPVAVGALGGRALGAFVMAVCLRIMLVHQSTFCINSFCHWAGKRTYNAKSSARDHWLIALFTFGEGYHSFHHRFPSDYRNGIRWYHWDPTKWLIFCLSKLKLASNLKRIPRRRIAAAVQVN